MSRSTAGRRRSAAGRRKEPGAENLAEQRLLEAQAVAHVGSWEWDPVKDVVTWSDELCRIYGLQAPDSPATYEGFLDRVHPDDRARVAAVISAAVKTSGSVEFEHRIVRPDGTERTLQARGEVVLDAAGRIVRMVGTGQDVTDRRRAESRARANERGLLADEFAERQVRERDAFLSIALHEIRTPITGLKGYAQLLLRRAASGGNDDPRQTEALRAIVYHADRLDRLSLSLLDASRLEEGRLSLELAEVDLVPLTRRAIDLARARGTAHTFVAETPEHVYLVVDELRFEQVVTQLLENAIKYSPDAGAIRLRLWEDDTSALLSVTDSGIGVPEDQRERIFERFHRAHAAEGFSGLGLGLYISREIVRLHGGSIWVEPPDTPGARFVVRLPRALTPDRIAP